MGGGTTDVALFRDGAVWHTGSPPAGRRPHHERHRGGAPHPDRRRGGAEEAPGLRADRAWCARTRRSTCRRVGGRKPRQLSRQTLSRDRPAPGGGDLHPGGPGPRQAGLEDVAAAGVVVTGGSVDHAGGAGAGGADLRPARCGAGIPERSGRARRRGASARSIRDGGGPGAVRGPRPGAGPAGRSRAERPDAGRSPAGPGVAGNFSSRAGQERETSRAGRPGGARARETIAWSVATGGVDRTGGGMEQTRGRRADVRARRTSENGGARSR